MATVAIVPAKIYKGAHLFTWTGLAASADDGAWLTGDMGGPFLPDKTVHVFGTFTGAPTLILEGTNEGTPANAIQLSDHLGNVLSFTAAGMKLIAENPLQMRPRLTAGAGGASLTVIIVAYAVR